MAAPNAGILSDALLSQTLRRTAVYDAGAKMTLLFSFFFLTKQNITEMNTVNRSADTCHLDMV